jgi:hypothetical protein
MSSECFYIARNHSLAVNKQYEIADFLPGYIPEHPKIESRTAEVMNLITAMC